MRSPLKSSCRAISMNLPDAEALCEELARRLRPGVTDSTGLVGIRTGGAWLAERLHRELKLATPLGALDISFYRDDFGARRQAPAPGARRPRQILLATLRCETRSLTATEGSSTCSRSRGSRAKSSCTYWIRPRPSSA